MSEVDKRDVRELREYAEEFRQRIEEIESRLEASHSLGMDQPRAVKWITTAEAVRLTGYSERTILRWCRECEVGELKGGRWKINKELLEEMVRQKRCRFAGLPDE